MKQKNRLTLERKRILNFFAERSAKCGINVNPIKSIQQQDILDRLYEEYKNDRGIIIEFDEKSKLTFDFFITTTQRGDDVFTLAYVCLAYPKESLDKLWSIYRAWLHDRWTENEMERTYSELGPG